MGLINILVFFRAYYSLQDVLQPGSLEASQIPYCSKTGSHHFRQFPTCTAPFSTVATPTILQSYTSRLFQAVPDYSDQLSRKHVASIFSTIGLGAWLRPQRDAHYPPRRCVRRHRRRRHRVCAMDRVAASVPTLAA